MSVFGTKGKGEMWLACQPSGAEHRSAEIPEISGHGRGRWTEPMEGSLRAGACGLGHYFLSDSTGVSALASELFSSGSSVLRSVVPLNRKFKALLKAGLR